MVNGPTSFFRSGVTNGFDVFESRFRETISQSEGPLLGRSSFWEFV